MTPEAATTRELWEQYQDAGEDVRFWKMRVESTGGTAIRELVFALFRQHMALTELLGIGAKTVVLCMLAFALSCQFCGAENLPDAPSATAQTQERASSTWHELRVPLTAMWATNAADMALTCVALGNGGHENFLPAQSCAGTTAILAGERAAATGLAWMLAHKGHHKMAKALLWAATGDSAYGLAYSAAHWNDPKKP